jgi:peptidyl-prolyl cis-trans isomerase C
MRPARLTAIAAAFASISFAAEAQTPPATPPAASSATAPNTVPPSATPTPTDPVVGKVDGQEIHLSDLTDAVKNLPEQYRSMPAPVLYPLMLDQLIDRKALASLARHQGLDKDPAVRREVARAEEAALQNAMLTRDIAPLVTDAAIRGRYEKDLKDKPGEEEIHAAHVLVPTEDEAKAVVAELDKGGDFAALAKAHSKDPGSANGGDLGWFKRDDMVAEFATAAFALKPGEYTKSPVKTRFGWHVIKLLDRRQAAPPTFEQAHDELRQAMIQENLTRILADARKTVTVERFNVNGSIPKLTDSAEPPPGPDATAPAPAAK